ncbi:MAG TPA: hypothetical protein VM580_26395, partial [Labilithrix sp.]|nr:hypothetical protein [Labilithrix sp.]
MNAATKLSVLPFENLAGDPEQQYVARGFVDDLLTELSRFPNLEVIHGDRVPDSPDTPIAHYLRGGVRRLGDVIRIAAQLVETTSGRQLWAERFDAPAEELLAAQDDIVARVVSALAIEVDQERLERARRKPLASLEIYDCWLRGLDCLRRGSVEDDEQARAFFERALTLDPHFARAHVGLSLSHFNEWSCQAWELWDQTERLAFEHARRALALDSRDGLVQLVLGRILVYRREYEAAARHVDIATELTPNDPEVLAHAALCRAYLGDSASALALATKASRLRVVPPDWYAVCAAIPLLLLGRYAELREVLGSTPRATVDTPAYLAAAYALSGDMDRAREHLAMFLDDFVEKITFGRPAEPGEPLRWLLHVNPFRRPEDVEHVTRGLRLAGLSADPDEGRRAVSRSTPPAAPAVFRKDGELWTLTFDGLTVQLTEAKGFYDLVELLGRAESEVHCLDLAGRALEPKGDAPVLDPRARRQIAARARELQERIDAAEAHHDRGAAEVAREELERLVATLSDAIGLGGR